MAQIVLRLAPAPQSSVYAGPSGVAPIVPVARGSGQPSAMTSTIPVDAPTRQEAKEAFDEVSSAFKEMPKKHG